jgi:hypothetical protein
VRFIRNTPDADAQSVDHGQKRELGGVTVGEQLTSKGPLQKAVYSLTRTSVFHYLGLSAKKLDSKVDRAHT